MHRFMDDNFLLKTKTAKKLYFDYAKDMPLFDYHCHLVPQEICDDTRFDNISTLWLGTRTFGDHYKWRQIRTNGFNIEDISDPWERFYAWAKTVEGLIGNPLYHWTHLELQRYFGIKEPLCAGNAKDIYDECNRQLRENPDLSVFGIFRKFNVYAVGTTDDPVDSLEYHIAVKGKTETKVVPSFRPDKAINIEKKGFNEYIEKLSKVSGVSIKSAEDVIKALDNRLDYFIKNGCLASDHSVSDVPFAVTDEAEVNAIFCKVMNGDTPTADEVEKYKFFILSSMGKKYAEKKVVMQLHMASIRDNNERKALDLGPDTGFDAVSDCISAEKLSKFLNSMERENKLPKMVLYSLNPHDYYVIGSMMGCFQGDVPGKIQLGSAWWFSDHKDGMEEQMKTLGNLGMLSKFVGMLTDSRSFLSYPRHEYFRRILCNMIGTWAEDGEIPGDVEYLGNIVRDISFDNARRFFENR